ncbi:MAG: 5'-3' exonuclease, partial [Roseovarius sp.]
DLMQLVGPRVRFYDFESGVKGKPGYRPERDLDEAAVIERWGVPPNMVADILALTGDTSDNVPGVPGIGPKTAAQLIQEYGDLETLLSRASEIKQPKRRETLIENADKARLSKRLVLLDENAPVPVPLDELGLNDLDARRLIAFFKAMEFTTITKRVATDYGIDINEVEADPA